MAYQTRQRDPFLDRETHAILVRRGQELLGLFLLGLGVALAALMLSYTPDDPNWMAATDTAPQNLLGRSGASVAAILMMIVGYGALVLPVASIVWGTRLVLHAGTHRALPRVFFLPIVLALASIYSASHVPPSGWTHSFGLGGLFGDTVLGAVLNALPMAAQPGLKLIAAAAFLGAAAMLMHVAGISTGEFRATLRFLVYGLLSTGTMIVAGLRGVGTGVGRAAVTVNAARIARREARAQDDIIDYEDEGDFAYDAADDTQPVLLRRRQGFLSRMPLVRSRHTEDDLYPLDALQPELPRRPDAILDDDIEAPDDDRVRARISDAIRNRVRRPNPVTAATQARLASGDAARADRLHLSPALRMEPPLTASQLDDADMDNIFAEDDIGPDPVPEYALPEGQASETLKRRVVHHAAKKASAPSRRAMADAQPSLPLAGRGGGLRVPAADASDQPRNDRASPPERHRAGGKRAHAGKRARRLRREGRDRQVRPGPVVTMYELEPAPGLKASA
jgi:S-DNA-T family DNA segregation ATPase FtsK/SpoIIIE